MLLKQHHQHHQKCPLKIPVKAHHQSPQAIKIRFLSTALVTLVASTVAPENSSTLAASCPDVKVIFARGSGAEQYNNNDYQVFKSAMESKLQTSSLTYEIDDLDYPAIGVGVDNLLVAAKAFFSGGTAYEFGASVKKGATKLAKIVATGCENTKYVFAGYSQGAMAVMNSLAQIDPDKIIYAATFGDPKIYLPEGAGPVPPACSGQNLSSYRIYVPDCRVYQGLLGAKRPYIAAEYEGKVGTWCKRYDIMCSLHPSIKSHTTYDTDGIYEDASRFIFSKIATTFGFKNEYTSPHDTAILIDSTGSMASLIDQYKQEALSLATQTIASGGRVALYDYRDIDDNYTPREHCNFETCTLAAFTEGLESITADGGGDIPESLLSASLHVMQELTWQQGSTKSLVILTDAGYHSPDKDGTTLERVVKLSRTIDPVNFYIITPEELLDDYIDLATLTGGEVVKSASDLSHLTQTIMERFDSLPRVEEEDEAESGLAEPAPTLSLTHLELISATSVQVSFTATASSVIVALNDTILGLTNQTTLTLTDLDPTQSNELRLIPLNAAGRGEPVAIDLNHYLTTFIPKAPNTGQK